MCRASWNVTGEYYADEVCVLLGGRAGALEVTPAPPASTVDRSLLEISSDTSKLDIDGDACPFPPDVLSDPSTAAGVKLLRRSGSGGGMGLEGGGSSEARLLRSFVTMDCSACEAGEAVRFASGICFGNSACVCKTWAEIDRGGSGGGTDRPEEPVPSSSDEGEEDDGGGGMGVESPLLEVP